MTRLRKLCGGTKTRMTQGSSQPHVGNTKEKCTVNDKNHSEEPRSPSQSLSGLCVRKLYLTIRPYHGRSSLEVT